jgi:predicted DNA-binding protein (MmcQ/YjbR family)
MDIEAIRSFCTSLPAVTEDVKWGNDLCFSVGAKMFCVIGMSAPVTMSFKVQDEEFDELAASPHFKPAPYLARYKWVYLDNTSAVPAKRLTAYIRQSYELIKSKLPKKVLKEIGLD